MTDYGPVGFIEPIEVQAICTGPGGTVYTDTATITPGCTGPGGTTFEITEQPVDQTGIAGQTIDLGGAANGTIQWQTSSTAAGPWADIATPPATVTVGNAGTYYRFCGTGADSGTCSNVVTINLAAEFVTQGSQILSPCGTEFWGGGMNTAFNLIAAPFVFQGFQGGAGGCVAAFDTPASRAAGCVYQGGGVNGTVPVFDPSSGGNTDVPDRYYAINGTLTATAASRGATSPAGHWAQDIIRPTIVCQGAPTPPTSADIINAVIPAVREAIDAGMVVIPEIHDLTGDNPDITGNAFNDPASAFPGEVACAIEVMDAIVTAFATTGTGSGSGSTARKQGHVWVGDFNEPYGNTLVAGCPPPEYFDFHTKIIQRVRNHLGAENIIVVNLSEWGQNLQGVANGCYDAWWDALAADPSGDLTRNVVLSWHAYGAQSIGAAYTYAAMAADLTTVLDTGTPGGHTFPLVIGEYGQARAIGAGNAGPDQWNRDAFEFLMTNQHGPALALAHNVHPIVWHATGDTTFFHIYALTTGSGGQGSNDGLSEPFWDVESNTDPRLTPLGTAHWDVSHQLSARNTSC